MRRRPVKRDLTFFNEPFGIGERNTRNTRSKAAGIDTQNQVAPVLIIVIFPLKFGAEVHDFHILLKGIHDADTWRQLP